MVRVEAGDKKVGEEITFALPKMHRDDVSGTKRSGVQAKGEVACNRVLRLRCPLRECGGSAQDGGHLILKLIFSLTAFGRSGNLLRSTKKVETSVSSLKI